VFTVDEIICSTKGKLRQGNPRAKIAGICTDSRKIKSNEAFLALRGKNFNGHDFVSQVLKSKIACLIVENYPKVSVPAAIAVIKVKDTTLALGDIGRFQRQKINLAVSAVTGSNGKTTAKEMVAWVLSAHGQVLKNEGTQNNQIGLPQTLIQLNAKHNFAVVEIGTNHFGEVDYLAKLAKPDIGIITNIGPSHLEFLKDLKGVAKEKAALLDNLGGPAIALLNADDKLLHGLIKGKVKGAKIFSYGINTESDFRASRVKLKNGKVAFRVNAKFDFALSTLGAYNIYNALAAVACGRLLGLSYAEISARLAAFKFPPGRLNLVKSQGLTFIDDTYNSNPLSLKAALSALAAFPCKGRKILVMADMLELGKKKELLHRQIAWSITNSCDCLITVGKLAGLTAREVLKLGWPAKRVFICQDTCQAREVLLNKISASASDLILVKGSRSMKMEEVLKP